MKNWEIELVNSFKNGLSFWDLAQRYRDKLLGDQKERIMQAQNIVRDWMNKHI